MLEPFVRVMNRDASSFATAVPSIAPPEQRGLVSECGFELARRKLTEGLAPDIGAVAVLVHQRFALLDGTDTDETLSVTAAIAASPEIRAIADNIERLVTWLGGSVQFGPNFPGCGYVSSCEGDLLVSNCLVEVKTVKHGFRSEHLRQLLTYALLNFAAKRYAVERLALANPREGTAYVIPVGTLVRRIAGMDGREFFERAAFLVSGAAVSA